MGDTYEESLTDKQREKLQIALSAGVTAQNQVEFTLDMLRGLIEIANSEKDGFISANRIHRWAKSVIDGLLDIQRGNV